LRVEEGSRLLRYRIKQIDFDGSHAFSKVVELNIGESGNNILLQNYPNPFVGSTTVPVVLSSTENIQIDLFDISGRRVRSIADESMRSGRHNIQVSSEGLSSGNYFLVLQTNERQERLVITVQ